jgi:hypothetical protein
VTVAKRRKLRPAVRIVIFEVGMLAGILVALFIVPRATPPRTFVIVSIAVFTLGNALLVRRLRRAESREVDSTKSKQRMLGLWVLSGLMLLYIICEYIANTLHIHPFP